MSLAIFLLIVVTFIAGGAAGVTAGVLFARKVITDQANKEIEEYRQRWKKALALLNSEGKITDKQLEAATDTHQKQVVVSAPTPVASTTTSWPTQRQLSSMWSEERRKLEIQRAEAGLAPVDSLNGMWDSDVRKVLEARLRHGTAK